MTPAHTYRCARIRRSVERSNDTETLPLRPFCRDCIIATPGYDFRKGHLPITAMCPSSGSDPSWKSTVIVAAEHAACRGPHRPLLRLKLCAVSVVSLGESRARLARVAHRDGWRAVAPTAADIGQHGSDLVVIQDPGEGRH